VNKVYSLLGLAVRSRNAVSGSFAAEKAVKGGRAAMVIVSEDASDNTVKMFRNMCTFYEVPVFRYGKKEELGHAVGKEMRTVVVITDEGFARSIKRHLEAVEQEDGGSEHGKNEGT